jgi:hypothetical protein
MTPVSERRIKKFAEENCRAGAFRLAEWNGLTDWLVVECTGT